MLFSSRAVKASILPSFTEKQNTINTSFDLLHWNLYTFCHVIYTLQAVSLCLTEFICSRFNKYSSELQTEAGVYIIL